MVLMSIPKNQNQINFGVIFLRNCNFLHNFDAFNLQILFLVYPLSNIFYFKLTNLGFISSYFLKFHLIIFILELWFCQKKILYFLTFVDFYLQNLEFWYGFIGQHEKKRNYDYSMIRFDSFVKDFLKSFIWIKLNFVFF